MSGMDSLASTGTSAIDAAGAVRRPRRSVAAALLALAAVLSLQGGLGSQRTGVAATPTRTRSLVPHGLLSLPLSARGPISAAIGAALPVYRADSSTSGITVANPMQHLHARFTGNGVTVGSGAATVGLSARAIGYGAALTDLSPAVPAASGDRVLYSFRGLSEWYANGPLGIEQGFTVDRAPTRGDSTTLTLSLALSGDAQAVLEPGADGVAFIRGAGAALRYTGLSATDAAGRTLHSWVSLSTGRIQLHVDSAGARFPLHVDPFIQAGPELTKALEVGNGGYGYSVALSQTGDVALVGANTDDAVGSGFGVGAVWAFKKSGSSWVQDGSKITGSGEVGEGGFGTSVALNSDGSTAIVGGPSDNGGVGAAWVFTRSGTTWTEQGAKLTGTGGSGAQPGFGSSVALSNDGDTALIGGDGDGGGVGAAWVFVRTGETWAQQGAKLTGSGESGAGEVGVSVALDSSGDTALVGGWQDDGGVGAAWVYTRSGETWTQQGAKLTGTGEAVGVEGEEGWFGMSVALASNGDTALIGGPGESSTGSAPWGGGAAWVFTRSGETWTQQGGKLTGAGEVGPGYFGWSVALSSNGNTALIGGPGDGALSGSAGSGAVWEFTRASGSWSQQGAKAVETGGRGFGSSLDASSNGQIALVGGDGTDGGAGGAWVFKDESLAPGVMTEAASHQGETAATVNATVDPNGEAVEECVFDYGTTNSYGSSAPCSGPSLGSGENAKAVSAALTGLTAGTEYHYRIVAKNGEGTSDGADQVFSTASSSGLGTATEIAHPASASDGSTLSGSASGGTGTLTLARFATAPLTGAPARSAGKFVAVALSPSNSFTATEFTDCELAGGTALEWWNPAGGAGAGEFEPVSDATYSAGPPACVTVTVGASTRPDIAQLTSSAVFGAELPAGAAATVKKLTVKKGPAAGGTAIEIVGTGFTGAHDVMFGAAAAESYKVNSATSISAVSPPGSTGTVDVTFVTANGADATTTKAAFKYESPTITKVTPATEPKSGGGIVTVTGSGFETGAKTTIKFKSTAGTHVDCTSSESCIVVVPAEAKVKPATITVDIRAVSGGKTSKKTTADEFTYG